MVEGFPSGLGVRGYRLTLTCFFLPADKGLVRQLDMKTSKLFRFWGPRDRCLSFLLRGALVGLGVRLAGSGSLVWKP